MLIESFCQGTPLRRRRSDHAVWRSGEIIPPRCQLCERSMKRLERRFSGTFRLPYRHLGSRYPYWRYFIAAVNHGTFLDIAHERGYLSDHSMHVGIRGPLIDPRQDIENDKRCGFSTIKARDLDSKGTKGVIEMIKDRVKGDLVYVSVDIDVLDPAYAPGTGTPEPGGWTSRELRFNCWW